MQTQAARPLTLHLVRHGRTRYNAEHRLQGWCDSELTDDGLLGVRATAQHLRGVPLVAAYASPSGRTVTTAEEILRHHSGVELVTRPGLREFSFGRHEAQPESELFSEVAPLELFQSVIDGVFPGLPGGESGAVYVSRVAAAFAAIERAHPDGGDVLVVSHGITLMTYLTMVAGPPERFPVNASVTTVEVLPGGTRHVMALGVDPSSQAVGRPGVQLRTKRVAPSGSALARRGRHVRESINAATPGRSKSARRLSRRPAHRRPV